MHLKDELNELRALIAEFADRVAKLETAKKPPKKATPVDASKEQEP